MSPLDFSPLNEPTLAGRLSSWRAEAIAVYVWNRDRPAAWRLNPSQPRPRFVNQAVREAYAAMEELALGYLRAGQMVPPGLPEQIRRRTRAWAKIDQAWSAPEGFVYVMAPADPNDLRAFDSVKIGFSADPLARLKQLQTGCHVRLEVARTIPGTPRIERAVHDLCAPFRAHGEWFANCGDVEEVLGCLYDVAVRQMLIDEREQYR